MLKTGEPAMPLVCVGNRPWEDAGPKQHPTVSTPIYTPETKGMCNHSRIDGHHTPKPMCTIAVVELTIAVIELENFRG